MEIIVKPIPTPLCTSFGPMMEFDLKKIVEEKTLTIIAQSKTKTRVHTSLKSGETLKGVDWKVDGFNTFEDSFCSMWSNKVSTVHYFKVSKHQSYYDYLEYIKKIVRKFCEQRNLIEKIDILTLNFIDRGIVWK